MSGWAEISLLVPLQSLAAPPAGNGERDVTVMTQNMDEGSDFGFLAGPFPNPTAFLTPKICYSAM